MNKRCKDIQEQLPELCFGEMSAHQSEDIHLHLISCANCMQEYLELSETLDNCLGMKSGEELKLVPTQRATILEAAAKVSLDEQRRNKILEQANSVDLQAKDKLKAAEHAASAALLPQVKTKTKHKVFYKKPRFYLVAGTSFAACFVAAAMILPALGKARDRAPKSSYAYAEQSEYAYAADEKYEQKSAMSTRAASDAPKKQKASKYDSLPAPAKDFAEEAPPTDDFASVDYLNDAKPKAPSSSQVFGGRAVRGRKGAAIINAPIAQSGKRQKNEANKDRDSERSRIEVEGKLKNTIVAEKRRIEEVLGRSLSQLKENKKSSESSRFELQKEASEAEEKFLRETQKFITTAANDTSTFSIDVDTASFTAARALLSRGQRPQADKIRIEEFLNYFDYHYLPPQKGRAFAVSSELSAHPVHASRQLLRVGVQAEHIGLNSNSAGNYVLLIDNSGSMAANNRLPAIKAALPHLQKQLNPRDLITLMTFEGGQARILTQGTAATLNLSKVLEKIEPGRETNLAEGLDQAYKQLASTYRPHAFNRLILFSDGLAADDNLEPLMQKVENYRRQGLMNSVIGVGARNYNDSLLEQLANRGDGSFLFAANQQELKNIFTSQFSALARTVARDVKIQLQMNKEVVKSYRLLGYENRRMKNADFRNDAKDAGEVGSGQSVTALYELQLHAGAVSGETGSVRIRYKRGRNTVADEEEFSLPLQEQLLNKSEMSAAQKLAYTVNAFADLLRNNGRSSLSLEQLEQNCTELRRHFAHDRRLSELQNMIRQARRLY